MDLIGLSAQTLAGFALTSVVIELTPGPNMAWLAIATVTSGRGNGYAAVAGVALGLATVGLAAALGLAALIAAQPAIYQGLRWAGVAYLLYLAWDGWVSADAPPEAVTQRGRAAFFRRGLVTNLLNPKAAVFYIAVLPPFLPPDAGLAQAVTLSAVYVTVATVIHAGIVTLAALAAPLLADPARRRPVARALSLMLAGVAVWFAWTTG